MSFRQAQVVVLIGDIVKSRRLSRAKRASVQRKLIALLRQVNAQHRKSLYAPLRFQFTGGDEFQGVFRVALSLLDVIQRIRHEIAPIAVRFGAGIGSLSTARSDRPQVMDGLAFHRARKALGKSQEFLQLVCISSDNAELDEAVNAWFDALNFIRSKWSERAQEVIARYAVAQKLEPVARALHISTQAVSKHLRVSGYAAYARGERVLRRLLQQY